MTGAHICPLCGHRYENGAASRCAACPLNPGCTMSCCPNCGYQQPDPGQSRLGRWAARWFGRQNRKEDCDLAAVCALSECRPGQPACVRGFDPQLSQARRTSLHAHGLGPGRWVRVLRQRPLTVVEIGAAELALENELAGLIQVERGSGEDEEARLV